MSETITLDPISARVLEGQAPPPVRAAAARGALPLPRAALTRLQVFLLRDPLPDVAAAAEASLKAIEQAVLCEVLGDPSCSPEVLSHFARRATRDEVLAERVAFHPAVPLDALVLLGATGTAAVIDLVLTNEQLLLARAAVIEAVLVNPALRPDQRGRLLEILERIAKHQERDARSGTTESVDGAALDEAARLLDVDVGELMSTSEILGGEEFATSEDTALRTTYAKILLLNTAQKAILAMKGGREERLILVRDSNRSVALAVLRNGRITDQEIESMARMRNVVEEVLRSIGTSREWTKSYAVVCSLVNNPRTPPGVTTNLVSRLSSHDLKLVTKNRDVPELIRRMAKRIIETREKPTVLYKRK
jgi:hypothetical protein